MSQEEIRQGHQASKPDVLSWSCPSEGSPEGESVKYNYNYTVDQDGGNLTPCLPGDNSDMCRTCDFPVPIQAQLLKYSSGFHLFQLSASNGDHIKCVKAYPSDEIPAHTYNTDLVHAKGWVPRPFQIFQTNVKEDPGGDSTLVYDMNQKSKTDKRCVMMPPKPAH